MDYRTDKELPWSVWAASNQPRNPKSASGSAKMLRSYIGDRKSGFLFETESGKMLSPENLWRDGFATIDREMGREGVSFHAFRRFREAVLQATECRDLPIDYWMGHSNPQMGSRYARQLMEDKEVPSKMGEKRRTR